MTKRKICVVFGLLIGLIVLIFSLNFYFLSHLNDGQSGVGRDGSLSGRFGSKASVLGAVRRKVKQLKPVYLNRNPRYYSIRNKVWRNFEPKPYENASLIWDISYWWPNNNEIYPAFDTTMGQLIKALQNEPITNARNSPKGTQLKLLLQLNGKQKVIFKPKWYEINEVIDGPVYSGKDRYYSEIVGFYLGGLLNLRWTPIAVGRRINLRDVHDNIGEKELKKTMTVNDDKTKYCVYGKCFYCKESESVCGNADHLLDGVMLHLIPGTLVKQRSPWQRTYKDNQLAPWEENPDYCNQIKEKLPAVRLLDLIDASIFDFLLQNGDRHHYETRNDRLVLIDNGKGLGNPNVDFIDVLAPLYQCCILRKTTWDRLLYFTGGTLSELMEQLTRRDLLYPLLSPENYRALERRLNMVYATVEICFDRFGKENVLK